MEVFFVRIDTDDDGKIFVIRRLVGDHPATRVGLGRGGKSMDSIDICGPAGGVQRGDAVSGLDGERRSDHVRGSVFAIRQFDVEGSRVVGGDFEIGAAACIDVGNGPIDERLGAVGLVEQIDFHVVVDGDFAGELGGIEMGGHRGDGCVGRLYRSVATDDTPVFRAVAFIVGSEDEIVVADEAAHHVGNLRFRIEFGQNHLLLGGMSLQAFSDAFARGIAFEIGAAFGDPDFPFGAADVGEQFVDLVIEGGIVGDGGVSVEVREVAELCGVVVEHRINVWIQRTCTDGAERDGHVLLSRFEAEIGGFVGGGVVPCGFRGEADVLLVPELPVAHAVAENFRIAFTIII